MATTISVTEGTPLNFQPRCKRMHILAHEGIDAFIIKNVVINPAGNTVYLSLFDPISPNGAQQIMELIRRAYESKQEKPDAVSLQLKTLDSVGTVIKQQSFSGVILLDVFFNELTEDPMDPTEIDLTFFYKSEKVDW